MSDLAEQTRPIEAIDVTPVAPSTALVPFDKPQEESQPVMSMELAQRRRDALVEFTQKILKKDIDYGAIPGTGRGEGKDKKEGKPTLLKPGAEKLCTFFGFSPTFISDEKVVDWASRFFFFSYKCILTDRLGRIVGEGIGSCNSREKKFRWRVVPSFKATAEQERMAVRREKRTSSRGDFFMLSIPNDDIESDVNTLQKMGQKRALIAATLIACGASEFFTQDMEDKAKTPRDEGGDDVDQRSQDERDEAQRAADEANNHRQPDRKPEPAVPPHDEKLADDAYFYQQFNAAIAMPPRLITDLEQQAKFWSAMCKHKSQESLKGFDLESRNAIIRAIHAGLFDKSAETAKKKWAQDAAASTEPTPEQKLGALMHGPNTPETRAEAAKVVGVMADNAAVEAENAKAAEKPAASKPQDADISRVDPWENFLSAWDNAAIDNEVAPAKAQSTLAKRLRLVNKYKNPADTSIPWRLETIKAWRSGKIDAEGQIIREEVPA